MILHKRFLLILLIFSAFSLLAHSQDVNSIDFENLRADQLSDQQIERLWEAAQERGLSLNELEKLAIARGMQPSEVIKLRGRLREIQSKSVGEGNFLTNGRGRDTASGGFFGDSLMTDSLSLAQRDSLQLDSLALRKRELRRKIFGYGLFTSQTAGFEPSLNIPTPENYQLGPGDELIIDIWGASENTYQLSISPEGNIQIPGLGPVHLTGLRIEEAREKLRTKLTEIHAGLAAETPPSQKAYMQVSLGSIRSIKVSMIGEVNRPGTYTLPSLATVFNALYSAGGPTVDGSFRTIEVIRNNKIVATLDIYDFLVHSDQSDNIRLQDQDVIKIPPFKNRIELKGEAKKTGLFEMEEGETLKDLLTISGGFTANAYKKRIKIERKTDTELSIKDVKKSEYPTFKLKLGDIIRIGELLDRYENRVEIRGAVFREGSYELDDTTTVYSLIQRAEGLRGDAFLNRGLIYRTREDLTTESIAFSVRDIMQNPEKNDIALIKDDIVRISSIFDLREEFSIEINGSVQEPGEYPFVNNMTLEDLIFQASGFKEEAAPYRIEVARRIVDGDPSTYTPKIANIFNFSVDENLRLSKKASSFTIQPFDKIFVRKSPAYEIQQDVVLGGEVLYPGKYTLSNENTRVSDIIERAGGLTQDAFPEGATLHRTENNVGQISLNLPEILDQPGSKFDYLLERGDSLYVPKELQTVRITGAVLFPVGVRYEKGRSFNHYIDAAGGYSDLADSKKAFVVYANGEVDRIKKFLFFKNKPKLEPGARIVVPVKQEERSLSPQERIGIITAIISTLAIIANVVDNLGN